MPDTTENQEALQQSSQAPGVGFPIAQILVIFSLAVGTVLQAAVGPYKGKETSELALLRAVIGEFQPGDIALADRFFCSYWLIAALRARGVDVVVRLHQRRTADFRRGRRLGPNDHIVTWLKPEQRPDWMSPAEYEAMPAELTVREFRVRVQEQDEASPCHGRRHDVAGSQRISGQESLGTCSGSGGMQSWICGR